MLVVKMHSTMKEGGNFILAVIIGRTFINEGCLKEREGAGQQGSQPKESYGSLMKMGLISDRRGFLCYFLVHRRVGGCLRLHGCLEHRA